MNEFEEMQKIYEEGVGGNYPMGGQVGQSIAALPYGPDLKYSPRSRTPGKLTYRKGELPTASPGQGNAQGYDRQLTPGNMTTVIAGDEEVAERKISNTAVISKIKDLITKAEEEDNPTCTYTLAQLMQHVKDLPEV